MARRRFQKVEGPEGPQSVINPVDAHVGSRVRQRRILLSMTQEQLGSAIGLTFQQIQKYERGTNRISASVLHDMSVALDIPVSFFFDDMPDELACRMSMGASPVAETRYAGVMDSKETLQLLSQYYGLPDPLRKSVYALLKAMNASE